MWKYDYDVFIHKLLFKGIAMSNIFVEVDEAMKQERIEKLWKQYGGFFIGFLLILILGTAVNAGYGSWKISKNTAQTNLFLSVTDNTNYNAADLIEVLPNLHNGLRDMTNINAAGLLAQQGETGQAFVRYNDIAENADKNGEIKQLALYMAANSSQDISAEEKLSMLEAVFSDKNNPWRFHARLDAALIEANITNNYTKARSHIFVLLSDSDVPKTLQQKAQSLDILYSLKEKIQ